MPIQYQILESDHLPIDTLSISPEDTPKENVIRSGIEIDPGGRRVAYHLYKEHPGEANFFSAESGQTVRVPAEEIMHIYRQLRPGQLRGQTDFAPVLVKLYELDVYDDAELVRKKVSAMFCGIIKKSRPDDQTIPETESDGQGHALAKLEPGTFQYLNLDEDVLFPRVPESGGYEVFMRAQLRAVAAGFGITYEMLTGDLTGVNYSSIRAGLLEFRRRCEQFQHSVLVFQFCRRVFKDWLQLAVVSGALDLPGYGKNPVPYQAVKWITPGWAWVDPLKDAMANQLAVENGFSTRAIVVSERGENVEDIDRENASDKKREKELGLQYGDPKVISKEVGAGNQNAANSSALANHFALQEERVAAIESKQEDLVEAIDHLAFEGRSPREIALKMDPEIAGYMRSAPVVERQQPPPAAPPIINVDIQNVTRAPLRRHKITRDEDGNITAVETSDITT